jgi:ribosomal protein S18 acetylase RimI-like enzyme
MGTSFLHYAPALGYRGSVFNLVYADNPASLRIWDRLGFQRVGLIPGAGKRTRTVDAADAGKGQVDVKREEVYYVDAHVIFKSFV